MQAFIARENELKDMQDSVAQTRAKEIYSVWEQTGKSMLLLLSPYLYVSSRKCVHS